jgi:hypothetical protein
MYMFDFHLIIMCCLLCAQLFWNYSFSFSLLFELIWSTSFLKYLSSFAKFEKIEGFLASLQFRFEFSNKCPWFFTQIRILNTLVKTAKRSHLQKALILRVLNERLSTACVFCFLWLPPICVFDLPTVH